MAELGHFEILDQRVRVGKVTRKGIVICNGFITRSHEEYLGKLVFLHELHDVFQAVFELLVQQFVTGLCTFEFGIGCYIFLLVAVCVEPILFYGTVQFLLLVLQL